MSCQCNTVMHVSATNTPAQLLTWTNSAAENAVNLSLYPDVYALF